MDTNEVRELIGLKHQLDGVVERVMMSQCHRSCLYNECMFEKEKKEVMALAEKFKETCVGAVREGVMDSFIEWIEQQ